MKLSIHNLHRFAKAAALTAAGALGGSLMGGCADETFKPDTEGMPGVLTVTLTDTGTRADLPLQESTTDERTVNHLQLFAFPVDGEGEFASFVLDNPTPAGMVSGRTYTIEDLKDGKYHIYIVGNMESALAGVNTEEKLKEVIIDHEGLLDGQYTLADGKMNLPMVYEPTNQTGSPNGVVTIDNFNGPRLTAPLKFACVKIAYRILFDNNAEVEGFNKESGTKPFGKNGFLIKSVKAGNLTAKTALVLNNDHTADVTSLDCAAPTYCKYWLERNMQNEDVITPSNPTAEINLSGQYYCYGTIYLPERYRAGVESRSYLEFSGNQTSPDTKLAYGTDLSTVQATGPEAVYTIKLGQRDDNDADGYDTGDYADADGATYSFDRGTYYEVIGRVKNPQSQQLEAEVTLRDWTPHNMAGDLSHTTLEVDKTRASITSLQPDSITFHSNRIVTLGCDTKVDGKDLVTIYNAGRADANTISFRLNSDIPYSKFGTAELPLTGTVKVYFEAGNLRKYVDVDYDASPLFEVTPEEVVIPWSTDGTDKSRTFSYTTNLDGLKTANFTSGAIYTVNDDGTLRQDNSGELKIEVITNNSGNAEGQIRVTLLKDPLTSKDFKLQVEPALSGFSYLAKTLTVTVKPPYTDYRIYFRPINDYQDSEDFNNSYETYSYSTPFNNGWHDQNINYYIYTQMGSAAVGNSDTEGQKWVWLFTGNYVDKPWNAASQSGALAGWYLYTLDEKESGVCRNGTTKREPRPGETLIIFNNDGDKSGRHRAPFDDDAGIQLFDYEDHEGYYIFDPLCSPYYKVFDSRPDIVTVEYRIFSRSKPTGFYITYGGSDNKMHTLKYNLAQDKTGKDGQKYAITGVRNGTNETWYMARFFAQAPQGDYAKGVNVTFENGDESVIYGGQNYYNASNTGIARGIYDITTKKWTMGAIEMSGVELTTKRIWLYAPGASATPKVYAWTGTTKNAEYPGVEMRRSTTPGYSDWYYIDLAKGKFSYCILNIGGDADKSGDLDISGNSIQGWKRTGTKSYSSISSGWPDN